MMDKEFLRNYTFIYKQSSNEDKAIFANELNFIFCWFTGNLKIQMLTYWQWFEW